MNAPMKSGAGPQEYEQPMRLTYHLGLFLATNAISDAYLVIDGPDCIFRKAEWVHGRHDFNSTLLDPLGWHRITNTLLNADNLIKSRGEMLELRLREVFTRSPGVAMICAMPHVSILGTQYDLILRQLGAVAPCPLVEVPSRSLEGDWLDGYANTLTALARGFEPTGPVDANKVAIIGHLMDRNEQDQLANVDELRRIVKGIGLELSSIWLSGGRYAELARALEAKTLIALPLGREAAKLIAAKTGATVIECDVPFGAGRTTRLLRALGKATGKLAEADAFIEHEMARLAPRLEWVIPHALLGKRVAFWGQPALFPGFLQMAGEMGMEVVLLGASASSQSGVAGLDDEFSPQPPTLYAVSPKAFEQAWDALERQDIDLCIGDTLFCFRMGKRVPPLEFGFPSHFNHALSYRPFLGFEGWVSFIGQMVQALAQGIFFEER